MLKGDASNRRFWRVALDAPPRAVGASSATQSASATTLPTSAIAIDLGPDDLPAYVRALNLVSAPPAEPPFLNVQRFFKSIGAAVPEIYVADPEHRMLLVEDVGETSLFQAALNGVVVRSPRSLTISRRGSAAYRACCRIATTTATTFSCKAIVRGCASG